MKLNKIYMLLVSTYRLLSRFIYRQEMAETQDCMTSCHLNLRADLPYSALAMHFPIKSQSLMCFGEWS